MKRSYLSGIDEKTTINDVVKEIQLSRFDNKIRNLIRYSLSEYLTHLPLPGKVVKVLTFGSVVKNIAVKGSDLDLTIVTTDIRNIDFSYFNFLTSWSQSPYGRTQAAAVVSAVEHHMRNLRREQQITNLASITEAMFPVLTFKIADVPIQLTVNGIPGLNETELTAFYFNESEIRECIMFFMSWAKFQEITGADDQPKNFIITQLFISFLIEKGYKPPIQDVIKSAENYNGEVIKLKQDLITNVKYRESPKGSILLKEFFQFLLSWNPANQKLDIFEQRANEPAFYEKGLHDAKDHIFIKSMVNSQNIASYLNYGNGFKNTIHFLQRVYDFRYFRTVSDLLIK